MPEHIRILLDNELSAAAEQDGCSLPTPERIGMKASAVVNLKSALGLPHDSQRRAYVTRVATTLNMVSRANTSHTTQESVYGLKS